MAEVPLNSEAERRQCALDGMSKFADENGATDRAWREIDQITRVIFIGTADDGREFTLGYMKDAA